MEEPVTIVDRDVLKVLSVETRMDILKELSQGNRTPSDLSKRLGKSGATIIEHLENMAKVGLVKKIEQPGKKWVFYTLTERGYGIVSSKSRKLVIILATSLLTLAGGFVTLMKYSSQFGYLGERVMAPAAEVDFTQVAQVSQSHLFLYISIALFTISLAGMGIYFVKRMRYNYDR